MDICIVNYTKTDIYKYKDSKNKYEEWKNIRVYI